MASDALVKCAVTIEHVYFVLSQATETSMGFSDCGHAHQKLFFADQKTDVVSSLHCLPRTRNQAEPRVPEPVNFLCGATICRRGLGRVGEREARFCTCSTQSPGSPFDSDGPALLHLLIFPTYSFFHFISGMWARLPDLVDSQKIMAVMHDRHM